MISHSSLFGGIGSILHALVWEICLCCMFAVYISADGDIIDFCCVSVLHKHTCV